MLKDGEEKIVPVIKDTEKNLKLLADAWRMAQEIDKAIPVLEKAAQMSKDGGTFAIDGHQERVGESIFLFAPSCVTVTNSFQEEASPSNMTNKGTDLIPKETSPAPEPAWGETKQMEQPRK